MAKFFSLLLLMSAFLHGIAQTVALDTIQLSKIKSNYPIIAQTSSLQFVPQIKTWNYCYNVKASCRNKTKGGGISLVNQIYSNGYTISYLESAGNIRLEYLLLTKHKNFWLQYEGLLLSRKTTLDNVKDYFHYTETDVGIVTAPIIVGTKVLVLKYYGIDFYTGENNHCTLHLIFDEHKRLYILELDYDKSND